MPPSRRRVEEVSAGGLVLDANRTRGVLIGRRNRQGHLIWSLPKGHVEPGETTEEAARREVREETGITATIERPLGTISFWFTSGDRRVHKTVHHFVLVAQGGELSDDDVEVEVVEWVPVGDLADRLSYPDERGLLAELGRQAESG